MAIGLIVLSRRWNEVRAILIRNKWMTALFLYMTLTIIWSNFPGFTFRRCMRSVGTFEMVLMVLTEASPFEAVRTLLWRLYVVHIPLSIFAIKYYRSIGVYYNWSGLEEEWIGLTTDKNSLGQVVACSGVFWLWQLLRDWPEQKLGSRLKKLMLNGLLLGLSIWLVRGSKTVHSSTAILDFTICSALLLGLQFLKKRHERAKRIVLGSILTAALLAPFTYLACAVFNYSPFQAAVGATGRDLTFTDRNLIWMDVLNDTKPTAIFGVGMGAFWVGTIGYDRYPMPNWSAKTPQWRPTEGHDGYLDVYAELGMVGLALLFVVIVVGIVGKVDQLEHDFQFGSLRLVLLLNILINNLTETSFLKGTHDLWFLFILMAINLPLSTRKGDVAGRNAVARPPSADLVDRFKQSPWASTRVSSTITRLSLTPLRFWPYATNRCL